MTDLSNRLFDLIWENDIGLGNIFVNNFSNDFVFKFVHKWDTDVIQGENKAASDDLKRSVLICPEVSCFTSVIDSTPLTFAHCVIRNNIMRHKHIFKNFDEKKINRDLNSFGNDKLDEDFAKYTLALESAAAIPLANSQSATADIIYSSNNWIHSFRSALQTLMRGLVESKNFDDDLRLIIPVVGLEFEYENYEEILKVIKETGLKDRVCYIVFAEMQHVLNCMEASISEKVGENHAKSIASKLFSSTFTHVID